MSDKPNAWAKKPNLSAATSQPKPSTGGSYTMWERNTTRPYINTLPVKITINGETWWKTLNASATGTYSYCRGVSQSNAEASTGAYDHITVVPDNANAAHIGNIHYTTAGGEEHRSYVYTPYDSQPGANCEDVVIQAFRALFMRQVTYSAPKSQSPQGNNNNSGSGGGFGGFPPLGGGGQAV